MVSAGERRGKPRGQHSRNSILDEVAGERCALPLLAFAAARVWDGRDRTTGTIMRAAYEAIGGVGGARDNTQRRCSNGSARHTRRSSVNCSGTWSPAEETRAVQDRDELLSIFPAREQAEPVLQQFIDARLLTSFERPAEGLHPPKTRVEIIHESIS